MSAVVLKNKREELFREINGILRKWPDLDRSVFFQAHYQGRSTESISRSLRVDAAEVHTILRKCEQALHASLRDFRQCGSGRSSTIPAESSGQVA